MLLCCYKMKPYPSYVFAKPLQPYQITLYRMYVKSGRWKLMNALTQNLRTLSQMPTLPAPPYTLENNVFFDLARRSITLVNWFCGFWLYLLCNSNPKCCAIYCLFGCVIQINAPECLPNNSHTHTHLHLPLAFGFYFCICETTIVRLVWRFIHR